MDIRSEQEVQEAIDKSHENTKTIRLIGLDLEHKLNEKFDDIIKVSATLNSSALIASFALLAVTFSKTDNRYIHLLDVIKLAQMDWYRSIICVVFSYLLFFIVNRQTFYINITNVINDHTRNLDDKAIRHFFGPIKTKYYVVSIFIFELSSIIGVIMSFVYFGMAVHRMVYDL